MTHRVENPKKSQSAPPYISNKWTVDLTRPSNNGEAQATLTRIEKYSGVVGVCSLHPPRAWFVTRADQLAFKREDRETLGRWAAGSAMPGRYNPPPCVTELRLRAEILDQVFDGWHPQLAFNVPIPTTENRRKRKKTEELPESSEVESTSETSTATQFKKEEDIADLYSAGFV